uniref:Uncharacterized protein n=1 Tax=Anguilla anguilla TaxID=7936 RepID=A0A0E9QFI2_ANGAN
MSMKSLVILYACPYVHSPATFRYTCS